MSDQLVLQGGCVWPHVWRLVCTLNRDMGMCLVCIAGRPGVQWCSRLALLQGITVWCRKESRGLCRACLQGSCGVLG
jgi:hypothetical protein